MKNIKGYKAFNENSDESSSDTFSESEFEQACINIENILTVFSDEGIEHHLHAIKSGVYITKINLKIHVSIYVFDTTSSISIDTIRNKFSKSLDNLTFLKEEVENLYLKLSELYEINQIELTDMHFQVILSKKN